MRKLYTTILFVLFIGNSLLSQETSWEKTLGGTKSDYLNDMKPTPDFGFILAGSSLSADSGNKTDKKQGDLDYFVWKMDENGNQEWQKSLGGSLTDQLYCINLTREGGYILGGSSNSPKSGDKKGENYGLDDFWVVKLNPLGEEEWQFSLGGKGMDILLTIQPTQDKGYILGGSSDSSSGVDLSKNPYQKSEDSRGGMDYWVIKLSEDGQIEWQRTFGGEYTDVLRKIEQTADGGYILGGYSNSTASGEKEEESQGEGDFWVIKLDKGGDIEWQRTIGGKKDDELLALIVRKEGYLLGGISDSETSGQKQAENADGTDVWVLFVDLQGEILWQKTYDISKNDVLTDITPTQDGNYLLSGFAKAEAIGSQREEKGIEDYVVIKIDPEGKELWRKTLGGKGSDRLQKTVRSRDGGYLLAGTSDSGVGRNKEAQSQGREDYWIVKLLDKDVRPVAIQKLEVYPNPAEDYVNVIIHEDFEKADMQMYDMAGTRVMEQSIRQKTTPISLQGLSPGVYVVKIITEKEELNTKLLKK